MQHQKPFPHTLPCYRRSIKQIALCDEWKGQLRQHSDVLRLCHTCRVVRPLRAKHCRICDRCVAQFDHHCPYIYNCVGLRNRAWFLLFTLSVAVNCSITIFFAFYCIRDDGPLTRSARCFPHCLDESIMFQAVSICASTRI